MRQIIIFLAAAAVVVLSGCSASPGRLYQQSHAIANFKAGDRRQIERIAIIYPEAQASKLQDQLITLFADAFFTRNLGYTTASVGNELTVKTLNMHLQRFEPTHVLRVSIPMQKLYNGQLTNYHLELKLIDTRDGVTVWNYRAEITVGTETSAAGIVKAAMVEMERDGVVKSIQAL